MPNSELIKRAGIIASIFGIITSFIGWWKRSEALDMLNAGGHNPIWEKQLSFSNIGIAIGVIVIILGAILFVVGFLKSNALKNPEISKPQSSTSSRLKELEELKNSGIITPAEYEEKRRKIIDEL